MSLCEQLKQGVLCQSPLMYTRDLQCVCVWLAWTMASSTHSAIDVGFSPYCVVLPVNHFRSTQHMEIFHHVLLHICQCGNLSEVACWVERQIEREMAKKRLFLILNRFIRLKLILLTKQCELAAGQLVNQCNQCIYWLIGEFYY